VVYNARMTRVLPAALFTLLASLGSLAFAHRSREARPAVVAAPALLPAPSPVKELRIEPLDSVFAHLPALRFTNVNSEQGLDVRFYDGDGRVDERQAEALDQLLADVRDPKAPASIQLDRRTLQLVVRAALHFNAREVQVVSAYRKPGRRREGLHATGKAIDFKLLGVKSPLLAAYLRGLPRLGVGIYTHPRTAYVHLDSREHSFHWLDASPPGRTYRELSIGSRLLPKLDATYTRVSDWPEGLPPLDEADLQGENRP